MPNGLTHRQLSEPSGNDLDEVAKLRRRIQRGDLLPPEQRLKQQLEEIVRKWDRLFGKDFGETSDRTFRGK